MSRTLTKALETEFTSAAETLAGVIPSLHPLANTEIREAIRAAAQNTALALSSPDTASDTAIALMGILWPKESTPPVKWWTSPIGEALKQHSGILRTVYWTTSQAAEALDRPASSIRAAKHRGHLESTEDGLFCAQDVLNYGLGKQWVE